MNSGSLLTTHQSNWIYAAVIALMLAAFAMQGQPGL